jgi:inhibitor of KinA sporulation pathway (predicted exonuclease)
MQHIIFDLEATCWEKGSNIDRMEIIEIGAARLVSTDYEISDTFSTFVRPTQEPTLSGFCTALTTIQQSDVDSAPLFPQALGMFLDWIGVDDTIMCSWGAYDIRQIVADCKKHRIEVPAIFCKHINLKALFSELRDCRPCGMRKACNILGIRFEGTHHRGIDDSLNISRIARRILPFHYGGESSRDR